MFRINVVDKIKTHFTFSNFFFENHDVCEVKWKNVDPERPQTTKLCIDIARWVREATNTHLQCVMLIASLLPQWLGERASMLRSYAHCLSCYISRLNLFMLKLSIILRKYFVTSDSQTATLSQILDMFIIHLHTKFFVDRWKEKVININLSGFYFP
jgi:hypothetical protein